MEGEGHWNSELGMRNGEEGKDKATDSHRRTRTGRVKDELVDWVD